MYHKYYSSSETTTEDGAAAPSTSQTPRREPLALARSGAIALGRSIKRRGAAAATPCRSRPPGLLGDLQSVATRYPEAAGALAAVIILVMRGPCAELLCSFDRRRELI